MKTDKFILSGGNSHALEMAMNREENGDWTADLVHKMTLKNNLGLFRQVLLGLSEIKPLKYMVDFDKSPFTPDGWSILPDSEQLPNRMKGVMKFDPAKIKLHLDPGQKNGKVIKGNELLKRLAKLPAVYGAQLLDFYLANPHLIPEEWKGKYVFFPGTKYIRDADDDDLYVRYLYWGGSRWGWSCGWLGDGWDDSYPAAVPASQN